MRNVLVWFQPDNWLPSERKPDIIGCSLRRLYYRLQPVFKTHPSYTSSHPGCPSHSSLSSRGHGCKSILALSPSGFPRLESSQFSPIAQHRFTTLRKRYRELVSHHEVNLTKYATITRTFARVVIMLDFLHFCLRSQHMILNC